MDDPRHLGDVSMDYSWMDELVNIDPQLLEATPQNHPQPHLPVSSSSPPLNPEGQNYVSEGEGNGTNRRKLNLLKCNQCRMARKKCLPEHRIWPEKCIRCLQHRPELECSEPQLNTRKRGPNLSKSIPTPTPTPRRRSNTRSSTSDRPEPRDKESDDDYENSSEWERPVRTTVVKRVRAAVTIQHSSRPAVQNDHDHPASVYLPLEEGEFRILRLDPGRREDKVVCSFVTTTLHQPEQYEAVSYLWGEAQQSSIEIKLRDSQGRLHGIFTRSNLHSALRSLRHFKKVMTFYVDALCINHSNSDEKSRQIAMKLKIFRNAENLCFWLGEDAHSKAALSFIPQILDLSGIDKLVRDDAAIEGWVAFVALLKNTVFSRLWLVQEVAVAQNVTLHCGQPAIHYGDLVDAVAMFMRFRDDISTLFRRNQKNYHELVDRKMAMAERFIDVSTSVLRTTTFGETQRLLSLEALVSQLSDFSSTNPRDRIFSVLAIAKDGPNLMEETYETRHEGGLRIDYMKSTLEVYEDFVIHAIERSQSLDILCRDWATSVPDSCELPSWVRPLQTSLQTPFDSNISSRTDADSLVGLPDRNYYNASRGTTAVFQIETGKSLGDSKILHTQGHRIDTISKLGPRASEGIILYEWLELGGCDPASETVPDEFLSTLVASRGPNGSKAPSWYQRAFLYCLHHRSPKGDINTNYVIAECEDEASLVVEFLRRVQSVIWNRQLLVCTDGKLIGLAPMAAQEKDIICILHGCSVPVVLRPRTDGSSGSFYQLVGECYVNGMMDGEAIERSKASQTGVEKFELR